MSKDRWKIPLKLTKRDKKLVELLKKKLNNPKRIGEIKMSEIKNMAIDAESVSKLKDKSFTVKGYRYEEMPDFRDEEKKVEKLILTIDIAMSKGVDYYPNKTSQRTLVGLFGRELDKWVNQVAEFEVLTQLVQGEKKPVLYVK